ncbi:MAG TPA: ribonuclease domain-containing protein [Bacteroidota bacterium]|nr:ribonuclease domain-containing protein [Bacteroidota bacterium]
MACTRGGARTLLVLLTFVLVLPSRMEAGRPPRAGEAVRPGAASVPAYALDVFDYVLKHGRAPRGYVGGRVWQNREHRLPARGDYREFDVHPKVRGVNRGAERIIVDLAARKGWYTGDHYRTFIQIGAR